jgi:long-subunit fatty acid transport protein
MGGAFAGLSDDATAVFANPAGLTGLSRPEISFELRNVRVETEYFAGGRTEGIPTGRGIDTVAGAVYATAVSNTTSPGFISVVYPFSRFVLAAARSEVLRVKRVADSQGLILGSSDGTDDFRDSATRNVQDLTITSYGVTVAAKLGEAVSVGGGLSIARLSGSSRELIFANPQPSFGASHIVNFSSVDLGGTPLIEIVTEPPNGTALEGRVGVLWKPSPPIQVGASYRRGPRFGIERTAITFDEPERRAFKVPDVFRAGVAVRPTDALAITSDVSVTDYKDLVKSASTFDFFDVTFPRAVEVHAGVEYLFINSRFFPALRFGAWREAYSGPVTRRTFNLDLVRERFPMRPAVAHVSVGGGLRVIQSKARGERCR